jgi:hypothetical protein
MRRGWKLIVLAPLAIGGFLLFIALGGALVQYLWNWLLPPLFGAPQVTFWQALGLLALCRILFGGFGHGSRGRIGPRVGHRVRERMAERCSRMTPEERERLRQGLRDRFGGPTATDAGGH